MTETDCTFCKIVSGALPAKVIYRDDLVTAFQDIHPIAPVHILLVPNQHIDSLNAVKREDEPILGYLLHVAKKIALQEGISQSGYRIMINTGSDARQSVYHIHIHLIGGRPLISQTR